MALVAAAQRGLVHRSQLAALGMGRGAVAHRVAKGTLHWVLPSVFAAGYRVLRVTWRQLVDEPIAVAVRIAQTLAKA